MKSFGILTVMLLAALAVGCVGSAGSDTISNPAVVNAQAPFLDLTIESVRQRVTLEPDGDDLTLVIVDLTGGAVSRTSMTPALAVGMLGDRRLSVFWPTLDEWGGSGFAAQRERAFDELPSGDIDAYSGSAFGGSTGLQRLLTTIYTLRSLGRFDDAHSLTDEALAAPDVVDDSDVREVLIVTKSGLLKTAGRTAAAISLLEDYVASTPAEQTFQAVSSLSELQVEDGRFADGIISLDRLDALLGYQPGNGEPLATDWVRACALSGLSKDTSGKAEIAATMRAAWEDVVAEDREPTAGLDKSHIVPSYYRFALCAGDGEALADYLAYDARQGRVPSAASWLFQPSYEPLDPDHAAAIAQAMQNPNLADLLASVRPLSGSYSDAVNGWRYSLQNR